MRDDIISTRGYLPNTHGDELSLKIASYPVTARYLAERLAQEGKIVCELCCGIGMSLIELSKSFDKVIGIDNDQTIMRNCRKNLKEAGVANFELLTADISSRSVLKNITADIVLYDIPYWSSHNGLVNPKQQNPELRKLIENIRELVSTRIVIYAPTHMQYEDFRNEIGDCEYLQVYIDGKYDRNFIFLGPLIKNIGKTRIDLKSK